jgi:hypothetical protein
MPQDSAPSGELVRVDLLARLEAEGKATLTALVLDDPDMPWPTFAALATYLGHLRNATAWWCGDLINFGAAVYGHKEGQVEAALVGRSPETLARWGWVCWNIPPSRRRVGLSFSHHEVVAKLDPDEQTRLLDIAEAERLNVHEFRDRVERELSTVESSTSNPAGASESSIAADPDLDPGELLEGRERAAERDPGGVCPACGQPVPERLPIVEATTRPPWA